MLPGVFSLLSCYDTTSGGMVLVGFVLTLLNGLKFLNLEEEREVSFVSTTEPYTVIPLARYSSLTHLKRVTAWILRFVNNCDISEFCSSQWSFIPEHGPHFGGLWESVFRSMKVHLKRIIGDAKLTFEELSTILAQVEACLNSRPLIPKPNEDDGIEALTPGHFLIGRPLESLPDSPSTFQSVSILR